jgi:hypothetical protein
LLHFEINLVTIERVHFASISKNTIHYRTFVLVRFGIIAITKFHSVYDSQQLIVTTFSPDSTRLLVGFARGQLIEYDVITGKIYRDLSEIHPLGEKSL